MSLAKVRFVRDLLARMDNNGVEGNDRSVAIAAHDEARTLADNALIPLLMLESEGKRDQYKQYDIYFVLQQLALNCDSREVHDFFLKVLQRDKRLYIAEKLLEYLSESPWFTELEEGILSAALPFAGQAHYGVLCSASSILHRIKDRRVVSAMLSALDRPKLRPYQILNMLNCLAWQGDRSILPIAYKYLESNDAEEVLGALICIASIEGSAASSVLIEKLNHGSDSVRHSAISFLCRYGDASALDPVAELLLARTARKRKWSYADYGSWVNYAALYLQRHRGTNPALVDKCFAGLSSRSHWKNLFDDERDFLLTIRPDLAAACPQD